MTHPRTVRFYLPPATRQRAEAGEHRFIAKIRAVLDKHGFRVLFHSDSPAEQIKSGLRPGYAIHWMAEPTTERGLSIRRTYFYPYWTIQETNERWNWPVARTPFNAGDVPADVARDFANDLRRKHLPSAPFPAPRDGFVYVPLQGRLLTQRSFQSHSPTQMIEAVLEHDPARGIIATLHPKETYDADEIAALNALAARHPQLQIGNGPMEDLLGRCDYVATQNSAVALSGFMLHKPAVLFGRIDFHHIAANVHDLGAAEAIARAPHMTPDYDAYLWWFLERMSINATSDKAEHLIEQALDHAGWLV
ncbi:MAG: hypothetical protein VX202_05475 [Pseudomonadota bacterium]|nr:hypothetical protein [Pseudomonadota bacterium]